MSFLSSPWGKIRASRIRSNETCRGERLFLFLEQVLKKSLCSCVKFPCFFIMFFGWSGL